MPLFTDGLISTLDQLAAQDTAVLGVANTEGIDATAKLTLAQEEVGIELTAVLTRSIRSGVYSFWWPGNPLTFLGPLQLQYIVVTSPLQQWHTFHTLELIYRDAYNNQLNDRYLGKWNEYKELSKWASDMLYQTGLGMVSNPVPIAQNPNLTLTAGSLPAATYFVQTSWVNANNEEGMPSGVASVTAPDQSGLQVTPVSAPTNATGWNVYAGISVNAITKQNTATLDPSQPWSIPMPGLVAGTSPGTGQQPNFFRPMPLFLQRG